jgi:hypothetical protein
MICRTHEALKYCNIQQGHEQTGTETETLAHTETGRQMGRQTNAARTGAVLNFSEMISSKENECI